MRSIASWDGFSGYNQIAIAFEDMDKTAFGTKWGVYASNVMTFGLKNAPPTFQKAVQHVFSKILTTFMRVFLDDFSVFGKKQEHLGHLRLCFEKCREFRLSLNPAKCAFAVKRRVLLGYAIFEEGVSIDPNKVEAIRKAPEPKTSTKLTKKDSVFEWKEDQIKAFKILKNMLAVELVLIVLD
ncbi:hypothetical protein L7F22_008591 [Adiantum nelumboides]|nr:hypothetical protein [Adiantum nelumboides]